MVTNARLHNSWRTKIFVPQCEIILERDNHIFKNSAKIIKLSRNFNRLMNMLNVNFDEFWYYITSYILAHIAFSPKISLCWYLPWPQMKYLLLIEIVSDLIQSRYFQFTEHVRLLIWKCTLGRKLSFNPILNPTRNWVM